MESRDIWLAFLASLIIFAGFYVMYGSGVSLDYLIDINSNMPEMMIVPSGSVSILDYITSNFSPIIIAVAGMLLFCVCLSILSVVAIGNLKYLLVLPIFFSGILFNFSILFLFFGAGLFTACLYVIPLGETYYQEFKKWKLFRVGSNAVGKGLLVMFLFVLVGSYIALSQDSRYSEKFYGGISSSISNMVAKEIENTNSRQGSYLSDEQVVKESMVQIRRDYPNLTEAQYAQMESQMRQKANSSSTNNPSKDQVDSLVQASLKTSPLMNSLVAWFPLFFSFTIWASLEGLRMFFFSPVSGIFTYILFNLPVFGERASNLDSQSSVAAIEYKLQNKSEKALGQN